MQPQLQSDEQSASSWSSQAPRPWPRRLFRTSGASQLVLEVPVSAEQQATLAGLVVAQSLHVIELGSQGGLLSGNLVLGGSKIAQGQIGIVHLLVDGIERLKHSLVGLVSRGLSPHHLIRSGASIRDLVHDDHLVLLDLALHLSESINLLAHLGSSIGLLPLEVGEDGLLLDVGSLHVLPQLLHLGLPLLVELHLSGGGSAGLGEPVSKLVDLPGHIRPLPLSLGSGLSLSLKLLFHCFNATLDLLDSLLGLSNKVLFVIQFGRKLSVVLLLVANNHLEIPLGSLKVSNRVLSHLQLTLHLPLLLLKGGSSLLFFVQASFELTESRFQL